MTSANGHDAEIDVSGAYDLVAAGQTLEFGITTSSDIAFSGGGAPDVYVVARVEEGL